MASVELRDASYGELPEICHVLASSFKDDAIWGEVMHPHRHEFPEDTELWFLQRTRVAFWDYRWKWLVAVDKDASGKEVILGCAQWHRKGKGGQYMDLWWFDPRQSRLFPFLIFTLTKYQAGHLPLLKEDIVESILQVQFELSNVNDLGNLLKPLSSVAMRLHALVWPNRAGDPDKVNLFEQAAPFSKHLWSGEREESWYLEVLGVHPDYQGRGIGNKLVHWGLDQAKRENICASVMSAPGKDGFYQKCGFNIQDGRGGMGEGNPLAGKEGGNVWWKMPELGT